MSRIFRCRLFKGFTLHEVNHFLRKYKTTHRTYSSGEVIFNKGDDCNCIGIVVSGAVEMQEFETNSEGSIIKQIDAGNIFGEVLLYSKKKTYPANVKAIAETEILLLNVDVLIKALGEHKKFLINFLEVLANRTLILHDRVKVITKPSLKSKIASYILTNAKSSKEVPIGMTKQKLAAYLNVQRPSLSRELISMKESGLIDYDRKYFYILDKKGLENI